jgi:membrane-bound metal-dependent hydrolase YbcI (DUF457 family)
LGVAYAGLSVWQLGIDPWVATVAGGLTALGGVLPDLDSDSGVPQREMFSWAAAVIPALFVRRMHRSWGLTPDQILVCLGVGYFLIRYGVSRIFQHVTVHRGMFHSIPGMLIAGMAVFLIYHHPSLEVKAYLAIGVMIGFLSHLILDEWCSVDYRGLVPKLKSSAGSALKFFSPSQVANLTAYAMLGLLTWKTVERFQTPMMEREAELSLAQSPEPARLLPTPSTTPPSATTAQPVLSLPSIPFITTSAPKPAAEPAPPPPPPAASKSGWGAVDPVRERLLPGGR